MGPSETFVPVEAVARPECVISSFLWNLLALLGPSCTSLAAAALGLGVGDGGRGFYFLVVARAKVLALYCPHPPLHLHMGRLGICLLARLPSSDQTLWFPGAGLLISRGECWGGWVKMS